MLIPARIRIIAVGRVRKPWIREGLATYQKRLPGLQVMELREADPAREARAILEQLQRDEAMVALTEEGSSLGSVQLAERIRCHGAQRLAFVIGGADGLASEVKAAASWQLSLSALTFPHDLARLLLLEQLYRARTILQGGPYHRS